MDRQVPPVVRERTLIRLALLPRGAGTLSRRQGRVRQAALLAMASAAAALVAFVANVLAARVLGPEGRGHVALVLQVAYFLSPLLLLGSDRLVLRAAAKGETGRVPPGSWWASASLFMAILLMVLGPSMLWLAVPISLTASLLALMRAEGIAKRAIDRYLRSHYLYQFVVLFLTVSLALMEVVQWWLWVLPYLALLPFFYVAVRAMAVQGDVAELRAGIGYLGSSVASLVVLRIERLILPMTHGVSGLGMYVVVATATEPIIWVGQSLADYRASDRRSDASVRDRLVGLRREAGFFVVIATVLGLGLWAAIVPIFGQAYLQAKDLVAPLVLASLVLWLQRQMSAWLLIECPPEVVGLTDGGAAIGAVMIQSVMVSRWGIDGAAWGSVLCYLFSAALTLLALHKNNGRRP